MAAFVEAFGTHVTPGGFPHHFWISGGALAVENTLKLAFDWKARKNLKREDAKEATLEAMKHAFRPEFINRLDDIIEFHALDREQIGAIVDLQVELVLDRVRERGIEVVLSEDARTLLGNLGYDPTYGARPLKRVIQREMTPQLTHDERTALLVKFPVFDARGEAFRLKGVAETALKGEEAAKKREA
jgi:hypothetical protein